MGIYLNPTEHLKVLLDSTASPAMQYRIAYLDTEHIDRGIPRTVSGTFSTTAATTLLSPGQPTGYSRVYSLTVYNADGISHVVTLMVGSEVVFSADLDVAGKLVFSEQTGFKVFTAEGTEKLDTAAVGAYTDEEAQDAVGNMLVDSTTVQFTYSDSTPSISARVLFDWGKHLSGTPTP